MRLCRLYVKLCEYTAAQHFGLVIRAPVRSLYTPRGFFLDTTHRISNKLQVVWRHRAEHAPIQCTYVHGFFLAMLQLFTTILARVIGKIFSYSLG